MSTPVAGPMQCARHPKVETGLACGRCETPICPRCMVMTDVGARCPECAPRRRLPQFEAGPVYLLRGAAAAAVAGVLVGLAWGLILPGDYGIFFAVIIGLGVGYGVGEPVSLATNRKLATPLQVEAALGVLLAYAVRSLIWDGSIFLTDDLAGYIATVVGVIIAVGRLRL